MEILDIKPTVHYLAFHQDVAWDLITLAILSPTKVFPNKRRGKNRYTYLKCEVDLNKNVWIINAFKNEWTK